LAFGIFVDSFLSFPECFGRNPQMRPTWHSALIRQQLGVKWHWQMSARTEQATD
jgi:hypothetical protein